MTAPTSASTPIGDDGLVECDMASLVKLANAIVGHEKIRDLKEKARPVTDEVLSKWLRSAKYKKQVATKLLYALEGAERITSAKTGEAFNRFVRVFLMEQIPRRGRPSKQGIISSVMRQTEKRPPGRPATMSSLQEREWSSNILAEKLEMLRSKYQIKSDDELYRRYMSDPLFQADVSDARAIEKAQRRLHLEQGTEFDRGTLPALKARYSREKRLPTKPKTGG